jgi:hypothetical protein
MLPTKRITVYPRPQLRTGVQFGGPVHICRHLVSFRCARVRNLPRHGQHRKCWFGMVVHHSDCHRDVHRGSPNGKDRRHRRSISRFSARDNSIRLLRYCRSCRETRRLCMDHRRFCNQFSAKRLGLARRVRWKCMDGLLRPVPGLVGRHDGCCLCRAKPDRANGERIHHVASGMSRTSFA